LKLDELLQSQNRYEVALAERVRGTVDDPSSTSSERPQAAASRASAVKSYSTLPSRSAILAEYAGDYFAPPPADESTTVPCSARYQRPLVVSTSQFPKKWQCDYLVEVFITHYQPLAPVVHVPTFLKDYDIFYEGMAAAPQGYRAEPCFLSLVYAIMFAGSVISSSAGIAEHFPDRPRSEISKDLYNQTTRTLREASFTRVPSIDSFTAYLVAQTVWYREEEPLVCW
jgi:Fungal specific transcription factor domain